VAVIQRENKKLNKNGISGGHLKFIWLRKSYHILVVVRVTPLRCFRLGDAFTTQKLKVMIFFIINFPSYI